MSPGTRRGIDGGDRAVPTPQASVTTVSVSTSRARAQDLHTRLDPHRRGAGLSDIILGGQDGLVNVLGVILGVAAATGDAHLVLVAGLAAAFAESVSMGAVAYTSTLADADLFRSEFEREHRHIRSVPDIERQEIRQLYQRKGFHGDLLDRVVETLTSDPEVWVAEMMAQEHRLLPSDRGTAARSGLVVGLAAIGGSLIPLIPFLILPIGASMAAAVVLTGLALFAVGIKKARLTVGRPVRSGLELAAIGVISALLGYAVGAVLKVPATP